MQKVAELLSREVHSRNSLNEKDLFARSAINRYYYACYRVVWDLLKTVYPNKKVPGHSNLPIKIHSGLYKLISKSLSDAEKRGVMRHSEVAKRRNQVRQSTKELSDILTLSYGVRCIADYEPDKKVVVTGSKVALGETTLHAAAQWLRRTEIHCGNLQSEWNALGN